MSVSRVRRGDFREEGGARNRIYEMPNELFGNLIPQKKTVKDVDRAFNKLYISRPRSFTIDIQHLLYGIRPFEKKISEEDYKAIYSAAVKEKVGELFDFPVTIKILELSTYDGHLTASAIINDILGILDEKNITILSLKFTNIILNSNPFKGFRFFEKLEEIDMSLSGYYPLRMISLILPQCKNLKTVNVSNKERMPLDDVELFASSLMQCDTLQSVSMGNCHLDDEHIEFLFVHGFNRMKNIREINISNNEISELVSSIYPLPKSVRSIYVGNCFSSFSVNNVDSLLAYLETSHSLTKINLRSNRLGVQRSLRGILQKNENIEELNLSKCYIVIDDIADILRAHTKLKVLDLSFNYFYDVEQICQILQQNRSIKTLSLREIRKINEEKVCQRYDGSVFIQTLRQNKTITALDISGYKMGINDVELQEMLKQNQTIKFLSLPAKSILNVSAFCKQLENNLTLIGLDLSNSNIRHENLDGLTDMLSGNKSITSLSLQNLNLNICDIMPYLQNNTTLRELNLMSNGVKNSRVVREFLENNNTITSIDISHLLLRNSNDRYEARREFFLDILRGLQKNTTIRSISLVQKWYFGSWDLDQSMQKEIADILRKNKGIRALKIIPGRYDPDAEFLDEFFKNHHPRIRPLKFNVASF